MKYSIQLLCVLLFLFSGTLLFSQENDENSDTNNDIEKKHPLLTSKFVFYVGAYNSFKTIKVGANGSSDNELINFSEKLDFDDNETTLFLNFNWRFARMWSVSAEYFSIKNGISRELEETIEWEDLEFAVGAQVNAGFNLRMYRIMIGRTITKGQRHELGAGLGVHALDIESFIEGNAIINNEGGDEGAEANFERRSVNALAPLPNIGAWYFFTPNNKWLLTARVDWFGITINEYSVSMWNLAAGANYQFHKNIGVGLKLRYFDVTANIDQNNWDGKFSFIFQGPLLTVNANF